MVVKMLELSNQQLKSKSIIKLVKFLKDILHAIMYWHRFLFEIDLDIVVLVIIINKIGNVPLHVSYKSIFLVMLLVILDVLGAHAVERYGHERQWG